MAERNFGEPFYGLAISYRCAADVLLEQGDGSIALPTRFLYSHAFELFFKAFLRLNGIGIDALAKRPYGHNLYELYEQCKRRGLTLTAQDQESLGHLMPLLKDGHAEYQYRYFEKSFNTAEPTWMRRDIAKLHTAIDVEVEKQRQALIEEAKEKNTVLIAVPIKMIVSIGE